MKRADRSALVHIAEGECPLPCEPAVAARVLNTIDAMRAEIREYRAALQHFNFPDYPEGHLSEGELAATRALARRRR